ncbi:hypothetical protein LTR10_017715 [Elasticomyces elasticus]|uniref:Uncharacterized protein n=1 Tax=Exophiala sideris TaxID=1016849 RepID=A0ABR0JDG3_9EURO|nr:hypothetical protein LTR10_017715 [Elasticomyces elasticus]KAK5060641.1 hypothetical protein LTR69_005240 [Exophiala sideris]
MADNNGTTTAHDQDTLYAGDVLVLFSRQAITFPTNTESVGGWDTPTRVVDKMTEAADILVKLNAQSSDRSGSTLSANSTISLSTQQSSESTWFHNLAQEQPLKDFFRLGLKSSSLDQAANRKEACWYLDENDWNVQRAIAQYQSDEKKRSINPSRLYFLLNWQAINNTWQNFKHRMLSIKLPPTRNGRIQVVKFPGPFHVNNSEHLRALNQWHADLLRVFGGPPKIPDIVRQGYKPVEQRFIRNRFADDFKALQNGGQPRWKAIAVEFNAVFQGRYLPSETNLCPERSRASVSTYIQRHFRQGLGKQAFANYHAALRMLTVREQEQKEYDDLRASSAQPAPSAIVEWDSEDSSSDYVEDEVAEERPRDDKMVDGLDAESGWETASDDAKELD